MPSVGSDRASSSMRSFSGSDSAAISLHSMFPMPPSLLKENFVIWSVATHLNIVEFFQLCAASKDIAPRGPPEAEDELWLSVANRTHTGLFFSGLDTATIKKLIGMVRGIFVDNSGVFNVSGPQLARAIIQAISQARAKELSHMRDGGIYSMTFLSLFRFPTEEVRGWLADPTRALSSRANPFPIGNAVLLVSLTVRNGEMSVCVGRDHEEQEREEDVLPALVINIRGLTSSMIVRKDVTLLLAEGRCVRAAGIFCPGSPRTAAAVFEQGLQCMVCVRDFVAGTATESSLRTACSLNLEQLRR